MTPTKKRERITPEGQSAKNRIAEVRQNVNNGMTGAQARSTVRYAENPTEANRKNALNKGVSESSLQKPLNAPAPTLGATAIAQTAPSTITSSSMTPTTPTTLADGTQATQAQGMMSEFTDATDTYTKDLEAKSKALEAPKQGAFNDYLSELKTSRGLNQLTAEAYAGKGGVDEITPELNDINDKIRREQLSMRRQTEAVMQGGGQSKAQAQAQINNIERESFAKQADLAVIQQAVQGRYDSAKEIADRTVSAQLEQQTNDLAILKFNYEENKDAFTKAEQRAFESAQADRERKLEAERQDRQDKYQLGIQASADGAPSSVVSRMFAAKSREEALAIGGSYIGALDRAAKQASIAASRASVANSNTDRLIKLAEAGNADAAAQLGITIGGNEPSADLIAYAQQYASTGKIPTGMPKNISFGSVSALAKDLPKPAGTMVNINTGVKDDSVGTAEKEDMNRLYNITQMANKLAALDKERVGGVVSGTLGKLFGSEDQAAYLTQRKAIVDEIARMQTGAALTTDEQSFYNDYLPGRFSESFFLGQDSEKKIENFANVMNEKLRNSLANNQLSIYGYSKINTGSGEVTVGDVVTNAQGQQGIVNADGTITLIGQ